MAHWCAGSWGGGNKPRLPAVESRLAVFSETLPSDPPFFPAILKAEYTRFGTAVYLTITSELFGQANQRFEKFAPAARAEVQS